MSLPLIIAAAVALTLLALAGLLWVRAVRSRRGLAPPVTEAEARAHAMPLTKSILSVTPQARERGHVGLDTSPTAQLTERDPTAASIPPGGSLG